MNTRSHMLQIFVISTFCSASVPCLTNEPQPTVPPTTARTFFLAFAQRYEAYAQALLKIANTEVNYPSQTVTISGPTGINTWTGPGYSHKPDPALIQKYQHLHQSAQNLRLSLQTQQGGLAGKLLDYTNTPEQQQELGQELWDRAKPVLSSVLQNCKQHVLNNINWYYVAGATIVGGYVLYRIVDYICYHSARRAFRDELDAREKAKNAAAQQSS